MLEDMVTFLVRFGFLPEYILALDVPTFNAHYASAMRCHYQDKVEDAHVLVAAVAQGTGSLKKGTKPPVAEIVKGWLRIVHRDGDRKQKRNGVMELLKDLKGGFKSLTKKG